MDPILPLICASFSPHIFIVPQFNARCCSQLLEVEQATGRITPCSPEAYILEGEKTNTEQIKMKLSNAFKIVLKLYEDSKTVDVIISE